MSKDSVKKDVQSNDQKHTNGCLTHIKAGEAGRLHNAGHE